MVPIHLSTYKYVCVKLIYVRYMDMVLAFCNYTLKITGFHVALMGIGDLGILSCHYFTVLLNK